VTPLTFISPKRHPPVSSSRTVGAWTRVRRAAADLTPDVIEQIAHRVAELLRDHDPVGAHPTGAPVLMDAAQLARYLGLTRAWIYQHADELGAVRIGSGPRARLRFDLRTATAALSKAKDDLAERPPRNAGARRPQRQLFDTVALLPVNPPRMRGIFARSRMTHRTRGR
jgi:hypothetical protein